MKTKLCCLPLSCILYSCLALKVYKHSYRVDMNKVSYWKHSVCELRTFQS